MVFAALAWAQNGAPAFEVVSIKPAPPDTPGHLSSRMSSDDAGITYSNLSLKDLIRQAYEVTEHQISGPDWIADVRFDIRAKFPAGDSKEHIPAMLQTMLADRFKLSLEKGSKEMLVYALVVAKGGPKLKPVVTDDTSRGLSHGRIDGRALSMGGLTELLAPIVDRPVVDETGLTGKFAFVLRWTPDTDVSKPSAPPPEVPSIYTALPEQLGLKLEARRMPVTALSVTHIERAPTEN